ncbi:MAG: ABC transporter permease subunit [Myxococcota bacterium]
MLDEAESEPMEVLEAAGASRLTRLLYGALPQVAPRLASYTLYRFEVNIRATAMVGFVGAGGLGDALHTALSLFHENDLAALIAVLFATVVVVDSAGDRLRARLLAAR